MSAVVRVVEHQKAQPRQGGAQPRWQPTTVGTKLQNGDRVRTGKRSRAEIRFADNSLKRLGERSELEIISAEPTNQDLRVHRGNVWAQFVRGTQGRVRAGTTVAAVQGTEVYVFYDPAEGVIILRFFNLPAGTKATVTNEATGQTVTVSSNQQVVINVQTGNISQPEDTEPEEFAGGEETPVDKQVSSGETTLVTNTSDDITVVKRDQIPLPVAATPTIVSFDENLIIGGSNKDIQIAIETGELPKRPDFAPSLPPPLPKEGNLELILRQKRRTHPSRQAFFSPRLDTGVFVFGREGHYVSGFRFRPKGTLGPVFFSFAFTPVSLFDGTSNVRFTEGYFVARSKRAGDLKVGRQWFIKGPIVNTALGTLVQNEIVDAITWTPPADPLKVDFAYMIDARPFAKGTQPGFYTRLSVPAGGGRIGLNWLRLKGPLGAGASIDFAFPVVPNYFDIYGEGGRDAIFRKGYVSLGVYFPRLYQSADLDVFLEYSRRPRPFKDLWVLRLYKKITGDLQGIVTLDKVAGTGGVHFGFGLSWNPFQY